MKTVITAGCGDVSLLGRVCTEHVAKIHFDGFTIHWHTDVDPLGRTRSMWRNGPSIRPNISGCSR